MQVDLIETFLDLMETRSFNRTAERLNITQSTVSHRVKALETQFSRKLFTRNKGGTLPTAAGLRFLDYAKALQNQWHEATRAVASAGALERSMRLGIQHDLAETIAGRWVAAIRRDLPTTEIYMEADYSNQMNRDLAAGSSISRSSTHRISCPTFTMNGSVNCITCWSPPMLLRWPG